jgi:hypothetical protein
MKNFDVSSLKTFNITDLSACLTNFIAEIERKSSSFYLNFNEKVDFLSALRAAGSELLKLSSSPSSSSNNKINCFKILELLNKLFKLQGAFDINCEIGPSLKLSVSNVFMSYSDPSLISKAFECLLIGNTFTDERNPTLEVIFKCWRTLIKVVGEMRPEKNKFNLLESQESFQNQLSDFYVSTPEEEDKKYFHVTTKEHCDKNKSANDPVNQVFKRWTSLFKLCSREEFTDINLSLYFLSFTSNNNSKKIFFIFFHQFF